MAVQAEPLVGSVMNVVRPIIRKSPAAALPMAGMARLAKSATAVNAAVSRKRRGAVMDMVGPRTGGRRRRPTGAHGTLRPAGDGRAERRRGDPGNAVRCGAGRCPTVTPSRSPGRSASVGSRRPMRATAGLGDLPALDPVVEVMRVRCADEALDHPDRLTACPWAKYFRPPGNTQNAPDRGAVR